jgi:hypothetical protein
VARSRRRAQLRTNPLSRKQWGEPPGVAGAPVSADPSGFTDRTSLDQRECPSVY